MKVSMFHLMPYRDVPDDFEKTHRSAWFTVKWSEFADAQKVVDYYKWTLDELGYAAELGFDGVCVNEHHQNCYGFMVNPNMMGAALAKMTEHLGTALVQLGITQPFLDPPIRGAEEYAMLDCMSNGRVVAGMPVGIGGDYAFSYGKSPVEQRGRYQEAHDLMKKAWIEEDIFAWNGKYFQLPMVNLWPRPVQDPHPPIWVPGIASPSTWDFTTDNDYLYAALTYAGISGAQYAIDGYWDTVEKKGKEQNPYRLGFLLPVGVAATDEEADRIYGPASEYFYHKMLRLPDEMVAPPGHMTYESTSNFIKNRPVPSNLELTDHDYSYFKEKGFLITGSPSTVREKIAEICKDNHIGNLMVLLQFGNMSHEATKENIRLFAEGCLPHLQPIWTDEDWENRWWPQGAVRPGAEV
tara:strand:+ start:1772 stop:2998 length:1227 start_codon:yes stop_codon:yes gene_type:complete